MRDGKYPRNFPSHMTPLTKRSKPPQQKSTKSLIPPSHSPLPWSGTPLMRLYFQLQVQTLSSQITTWKSRTNLSQLRTFLGLGKGTRSYSWKMVSTLFGLLITLLITMTGHLGIRLMDIILYIYQEKNQPIST